MPRAVQSILAVAAVVLLAGLVVLGVRGGDGAGDPTALDAPTTDDGTGTSGEGVDPADTGDVPSPTVEDTPSPTEDVPDDDDDPGTDDGQVTDDDQTTDADDGAGEGSQPAGGDGADDGDGTSVGSGSGEADTDDGDTAIDDMPDTGAAGIAPLAGLLLAGAAFTRRR